MANFLITIRKENWETVVDNDYLIGFASRFKGIASNLNKGDNLIVYLGSRISSLAAILEVTSDTVHFGKSLIWDEIYPYRIKTKPIVVLDQSKYVYIKPYIGNISFIKEGTKNFGSYFQHVLRKLNDSDYTYISELILSKAK